MFTAGNNTVYFDGSLKTILLTSLLSFHPEMVDFGFRQSPSEFSTAGIPCDAENWKRA
jgi:hypothetical protein